MKLAVIITAAVFAANVAAAQVAVDRNLNLELAEKDATKSALLEQALNGFLAEALTGEYTPRYVDSAHVEKYKFFFNKISGIGSKNPESFFNPTVLKSYTADGERYRLTVGFYGVRDSKPFIYQITELIAVPHEDGYRFECPFKENTKHFKSRRVGSVTYYYSHTLDADRAEEFVAFKEELAEITDTPDTELDYFCFRSLDELLKSYGFLYSARQCNFLCYDLGFADNAGATYMTGTANENYAFGYVGEYLYHNLPNQDQMYWPFVQGLATYYGGYALSYDSLETLKEQFRMELANRPTLDFLEEFKKGRKSSVQRHFSYYVMSAFLCERLMEQGAFEDVLKLAYSGNDGALFFDTLHETMGINERNFHESILELIEQ